MTREEQLRIIKTAGILSGLGRIASRTGRMFNPAFSRPAAYAEILSPTIGTAGGMLAGGVMGAQANEDNPILGAALGAAGGGLAGSMLGRGVRGAIRGTAVGKPISGAMGDISGHVAFPIANNLLPVAGSIGGGLLGWGMSPLGEEGSGAMYGALAGAGLGALGRAGNMMAYKKIRNLATGANTPHYHYTPQGPVTVPQSTWMRKQGSYDTLLNASYSIPGTPIGVRLDSNRGERLPGMASWVPREFIEQAFRDTDQGRSEQESMDYATHAGLLTDPLMGAALGGLSAPVVLKNKDEMRARLIGALAGGAAGLAKNIFGQESRREAMREALRGVRTERERFPMQKREDSTAASVPPMLLSSGSGEG